MMTPIDDQMIIITIIIQQGDYQQGVRQASTDLFSSLLLSGSSFDCSSNCDDILIFIMIITWHVPGEYQPEAA